MQLFLPDSNRPGSFTTVPIDGLLALDPNGVPLAAGADGAVAAWVLACGGAGSRRLGVLIARPGRVRVNGVAALPVTVLRRGDALALGAACLFYTDDRPARVEPFDPEGRASIECARCRAPIGRGDPVVACPGCGAVYMAQPDRAPNCWTIGACLACGRDPLVEHAWRPPVGRRRAGRTIEVSTREGTFNV